MTEEQGALVQFQSDGRASILNYNIPDSTSYGGQGYIDLGIAPSWFVSESGSGPTFPEWVRNRYDLDVRDVVEVPDVGDTDEGLRDYEGLREAIRNHEAFKRLKKDLEDRLEQDSDAGVDGVPAVSPEDPDERKAVEVARLVRLPTGPGGRPSPTVPMALRVGESVDSSDRDLVAPLLDAHPIGLRAPCLSVGDRRPPGAAAHRAEGLSCPSAAPRCGGHLDPVAAQLPPNLPGPVDTEVGIQDPPELLS